MTWEGPEHMSEVIPIKGGKMHSLMDQGINRVVTHIDDVTKQRVAIQSAIFCFTVDPSDTIYLLNISSIRLKEDPLPLDIKN